MKKIFFVLFLLALSAGAYALPVAGTNIAISMANYNPAPAEAGKFVTVWFDVTNRGSDIAEDVQLTLVPAYPFTLPDNDPVRTISIPSTSNVRVEYRLFVDREAPDTLGELKLITKISSAATAEFTFNITIDNTVEDAELQSLFVSTKPTPFPGGTFNISVDVVNANKGTAYYVLATAESPVADINRNKVFIGTLEPNDYDNIDFEMKIKPNTAPGTYPLKITFTYRDKDSKLFADEDMVDFTVAAQGDASDTASLPVWMYAINIVVLLIVIRLAIPFFKWFIKPFRHRKKAEK
jgi:hypothetical protein